jgi:predicted MFS family arabinose efflux permease
VTENSLVAWRQVACCFVVLTADSFIATGYSLVSVPLGHEFHSSRMMLMLAMTVTSAATAVLSPLLGGWMDRRSLRAMMIVGAISLASGYAAISFVASFAYVLVIFGVLIAPANILIGPVAVTVLLTRWFTEHRGRAIGIAIAGIAMGSVVYPPVLQYLLEHHPWRDAFRLMALVLLAISLPAALAVVSRPEKAVGAVKLESAAPAASGPIPAQMRDTLPVGFILSDPAFWLAVSFFSIVLSGMIGMITNIVPVALDRGIKAGDAALLISVYGISGLCAKLTFAALADRLSPRTLLSTSLAGFAIGMLCLAQTRLGYAGTAVGVTMIGLAGGLMVPMQSFLVPKIFGAHSVGRAMGCMTMVSLCALLLTPPLVGRLSSGNSGSVFVGFAVIAAVAIAAVPMLRLHPRAQLPNAAVVESTT